MTQDTVSSSGVSESVALDASRSMARLVVDVAMLTLGARLSVTVETGASQFGWETLHVMAPITVASSFPVTVSGVKTRLRVRYDIAGGSVTFGVTGITEQTFCIPADVYALSLPAATLELVGAGIMADASLAATDEALSYLGAHFEMPLKSWGYALRLHTANMAAYHALKRRGFNPDADPSIRQGYDDAIAWLKGAAGSDPSIVDTTPETGAVSVFIVSDPPRGWQRY